MKPDLIRRNDALRKTQERFAGKEFKLGENDCVKLVRFHLKAMGSKNLKPGHKVLATTGHYKTAAQAAAALKKQGAKNLEELLDIYLERIPPAAMLPGDIALLKSEPDAPASELGTIAISLGRKLLGWHPDHPILAVIEPIVEEPAMVAWRA
jgi:nucleoside-diphosphate-sugar epimerase